MSAEIKIFASLPILPFLRACGIYFTSYFKLGYLCAVGFMALYFLLEWLSPAAASQFGYAGLIAGLLAVGLPHGAVDHLLVQSKKFNLVRFVVQYVCIIAAYFALWQWFPVFSLILFIVYSAYHFGESEMVEMGVSLDSVTQKLYAFIIGLSILLFIIFSHLETSILVINSISGVSSFIEKVDLYTYKNVVLAVSYFSIIPIWWMSKKTCIYLMLILVLGMQMPLLLAFGLYFVGSHSINAWGHIASKLQTPTKKLYLQSLPFNMGAIFIFAIFLYLQSANASLIQSYAATFFVFLACVSLPHIILMHLFYKKEA